MKNNDKHYLKALLLASMSSIGITASNATGTSNVIARKEREGSDTSTEMVSEALTSGVLESHPSFGEIIGHTSHTSHGSHGSHTSHVSSGPGGGGGGGGGGGNKVNSTKVAVTALGGLAGTVALTYLIDHIIKKRSKHVATRKAKTKQHQAYSSRNHIKTDSKHVAARKAEINRNRAYASRDLKDGMYGNDVDRMTDLLVENDVLKAWDRTVSRKWSHIKYNRKVKRSVKQMQARMGQQRTGKASKAFQMNLQQWKNSRAQLISAASIDSMDIAKEHDALLAVAILLVEKGYLNSYDADDIMSEHEKSKIIKAYKTFLRRNQLPESTLVDEQRLRLLNSLPNKQK